MTPSQFLVLVIRPALGAIREWSQAAEELLLGTAIQESGLRDIAQIGGGPAVSPFQMERPTYDDIYKNFLASRPELRAWVDSLCAPDVPAFEMLEKYPLYACALARVKYLRAPEPLPAAGDLAAQAAYWKRYYNTAEGAGTAAEYIANWNSLVGEA